MGQFSANRPVQRSFVHPHQIIQGLLLESISYFGFIILFGNYIKILVDSTSLRLIQLGCLQYFVVQWWAKTMECIVQKL